MAGRLVLALVPDLMFATQIEQVVETLGDSVTLTVDTAQLLAHAREDGPALILLDLAARGMDIIAAVRSLKADPVTRAVPVIAFGPHLDAAARQAAAAAGADAVVANSKLAFDLPGLLSRYGRA